MKWCNCDANVGIYPTLPHHNSNLLPGFSCYQMTFWLFLSDKAKSSTDPASPSSRGVARSNVDVASRTIHTLTAFHWHTHRQGRVACREEASALPRLWRRSATCHGLPDLLRNMTYIVQDKRADFDFVSRRMLTNCKSKACLRHTQNSRAAEQSSIPPFFAAQHAITSLLLHFWPSTWC